METTSGARPTTSDERHPYETDESSTSTLSCCCGNPDCVKLQQNSAALADLERDVQTAAQLGQALLKRHETYVADSEKERKAMMLRIEQLEQEKREMEQDNGTMIEENRELLKQLELLNKTIIDSDTEIKGMAVTLQTTKNDMHSLAQSAMRVALLEDQINQMEIEQVELNEQLELAREDESAAISRWKKAEYMLQHLENELVQLEKESREERERHNKVIERMERRRAVEKELETAAARLKGAAAASSSLGLPGHSSLDEPDIVTSFVSDILQDNATLQAGIVELRDMLDSSNDEVQVLRDQLLMDRPMSSKSDGQQQGAASLGEELTASLAAAQPQSGLHVHHHHYHSPIACNNTKVYMPVHRRQRRRRTLMAPANTESTGQNRSKHRAHDSLSSISTILSQTAATIPPPPHTRRWASQSTASGYPMASIASSPRSRETSSIFSRVDRGVESSRPTSPESSGMLSPPLGYHCRKASDASFRSVYNHDDMRGLASPIEFHTKEAGTHHWDGAMTDDTNGHLTIPEEREECDEDIIVSMHSRSRSHDEDLLNERPRTPLRRTSSHDCSGARHKYDTAPPDGCIRVPKSLITAGAAVASPPVPVLSETTITADKALLTLSSARESDPQYLLHKVAAALATAYDKRKDSALRATPASPAPPKTPSQSPARPTSLEESSADKKPTFSQRIGIGGWVFGKWGMMPTRSNAVCDQPCHEHNIRRPSSSPPIIKNKEKNTLSLFFGRSTGVNQKGPIPGLRPPPKTPVVLEPTVDHELLKESLQE
ncbi:hypothetical protein KEM56_007137 [Ascosphaera pollenicola]|nr:hypothetical protein KEM56_007137 [Ascosphaera pollenicola]